ncbi:MAG: DNA helicase RecQ [Parabacteroides sp.]|nr:DNA helicase RecQ [Parabacteroides sp.]
MQELLLLLKRFFGYTSFRPQQAEIIQRILQKKDTLVLMPTGGGKSICFQLPAIYMPGTALVVSPLIALMKDQVEGLVGNGIPAAMLNSMMPEEERHQVRQLCIQGKIKLLYISPEGIMNELHWLLPRIDISLIAIDEAHCISQWGHDFRPEYTQLAVLKAHFPEVPVIALTATADKITRTDIINQLDLQNPETFISSFDRPNLSLTIRRGLNKKEKFGTMVHFINKHHRQSGIIYCISRNNTESVAKELADYGIDAVAYHAGLTPRQREKAQDDFINDRVNVVCATVAFGMGIDKSNVRWVIHYNMPGSIENYYQEIGRAGRDGMQSDTLLFYSVSDLIQHRRFAEESGQKEINLQKIDRMRRYCEADICRRRILLSYFGEETNQDCGNCDVCKNPPKRFDGSILVQKALSGIYRTYQQVNMQWLIDILRGSARADLTEKGYHLLKTYGVGRDLSYKEWKEYLYQMLQLGYIEIDYLSHGHLKVTPLGDKVLRGEQQALLTVYQETKDYDLPSKKDGFKYRPIRPKTSDSVDETLFDSLKQLRKQIAEKEQTPAYIIFSDDALADMVLKKPVTLDEFSEIRGVGQLKLDKYGKVFVALIRFVLRLPKSENS